MKNVTLVGLALSFALAACSDSNTGTVSFALTARQAAAPAGSAAFSSTAATPSVAAAGDSTVIMLGNDTITVTVQAGQSLNVTLRADISGWYLNAAKTALVDPASAN